MRIIKTNFKGLLIVKQINNKDKRGQLRETFNDKVLNKRFKFEYCTTSKSNILRGFHFQTKYQQSKFVNVLKGKILDVVIDLRKNSKTFGKYFSIIISQNSEFSFYIPKGFAHGFLCLSKECTVNYRCSQYRHKTSETTLFWKDKNVGIKWPVKKPILSDKDKKEKVLNFFK